MNNNRNPGKSKSDIEAELKRRFGVQKVIWLPGVRGGDITDGHIDGSVRVIRQAFFSQAATRTTHQSGDAC